MSELPPPKGADRRVGQAVDMPGSRRPQPPEKKEEPEEVSKEPEVWGPDPVFKDQYRPDAQHLWRHGKQRTVVVDLLDTDDLKVWNAEQAKFHPENSPKQILACAPLTVPIKGGKLILVANLIDIEYLQVVPQSTFKPPATDAKASS